MHREAPFIWVPAQAPRPLGFTELLRNGSPGRDDGVNRWFLFRRRFELPSAPERAKLAITVDGRYRLFVNGEHAGRGPVRSSPLYLRYDEIDPGTKLRAGVNQLAVLVHVYGVDTGWYQRARDHWQSIFGDGGLYCVLRARCGDEEIVVRSDEQWRCRQADAWNSDTPRVGWGQDFIEELDGRRLPEGWTDAGFDDSDWPRASVMRAEPAEGDRLKGWGAVEPFPTLLASDLPPQREGFVPPREVLRVYLVEPRAELALDERIYRESVSAPSDDTLARFVEPAEVDGLAERLRDGGDIVTLRTAGDRDVALLLKFDPLVSGYPCIEFEAKGGEIVEMAVAETIPGEYTGSLPEHPRPVKETYLDCAHVARYTARPGRQRFERFDWSAVRYLFVVLRNVPDGVTIRRLGVTGTHYPAVERGAFECSDDFLNRLWAIGRYTALQCTHDAWIDGPGREKRQWLGDGLVHYLIDTAAFGPSTGPVDRQFLMHGAESQRPDGLMQMFAPGDHHYTGVLIPDFNLHWVCAVHAYFMYTGDERTAETLLPAAQRSLAWFERQLGPNGLLVDLPYWHFIEWANTDRRGEAATVNAMLAGALRAAAELAVHLGYERLAERYRTLADRIADALNARHWNAERGLYVDSVDPRSGRQRRRISQHANAAMILWDIAPRERWPGIVERMTDRERLRLTAVPPIVLTDEPFDPDRHIVRANTYFNHFVYGALARAGRFDIAMTLIREHYRGMLESGTSTLWESYEPGASTCHAFSASPVYHLSANALGVQPLAPGFRRFRVAVQPGDLARAEGVYPAPAGDIRVAWRKDGGRMDLRVSVPEETAAEVRIPPGYTEARGDLALGPGDHELRFT